MTQQKLKSEGTPTKMSFTMALPTIVHCNHENFCKIAIKLNFLNISELPQNAETNKTILNLKCIVLNYFPTIEMHKFLNML